MPVLIDVPLIFPDNAVPSYNMGSIMHGMLMEKFTYPEKESFHLQGLKPFTQHLAVDKDKKVVWRICGLVEEVEERLKELVAVDFNGKDWYLSQKGYEIKCGGDVKIVEKSYARIAEECFVQNSFKRKFRLKIRTPMGFKKDGRYVTFPSAELIIKSLYSKWGAFSKGLCLDDEEICEQLCANTYISGYNLKSAKYNLEGTSVSSFIGYLEIGQSGPDALARLGRMLFEYSIFCGIGMKATLGMGGVEIEE